MKIYPNFDEVLWPFSKIQVREKRNWSRWSHSTSDQSAIEQTFRKPLILEYKLQKNANVNTNGNVVYAKRLDLGAIDYLGSKCYKLPDGNVAIAGIERTGTNSGKPVVGKVNISDGSVAWLKKFDTSINNSEFTTNITSDGGVVVWLSGTIMKLNATGTVVWSKKTNSTTSFARCRTIDVEGDSIFCFIANDGRLLKLKSDGSIPSCYNTDFFVTPIDISANVVSITIGNNIKTPTLGDLTLSESTVSNTITNLCPGCNTNAVIAPLIPSSFCINQGISVQSISTGATSYSWYRDSLNTPPVATGQSAIVNFSTSGNHKIFLVASNGNCSSSASVDVTINEAPSIAISSTNEICSSANGTALVTINSASAGTSVIWSNGQTTSNISGLMAGTYTVLVTNANGCSTEQSVTITNTSTGFALLDTVKHVTCNGLNNGLISLGVTNAVAPVTYAWSNTATSRVVSNLAPNTYTTTVSDAAGCVVSRSFTITQPSKLVLAITAIDNNTCGGNSGMLVANPTGGTVPYAYLWSNAETTQTINGLVQNNYYLTVTDSKGCTDRGTGTIGVNSRKGTSFYSNSALAGISNAVLHKGQFATIIAKEPTANFPGYPDTLSQFVKLDLINESGVLYNLETSPAASHLVHGNLTLTPDGQLSTVYQAPTGTMYGFRGMHRIYNCGSALTLDEQIFSNANWGAWMRHVEQTGKTKVLSFAHAGYIVKYFVKNGTTWTSYNASNSSNYMGDIALATKADTMYYSGNFSSATPNYLRHERLFDLTQSTLNFTGLKPKNNCDIALQTSNGLVGMLYNQSDSLRIVENISGSNWSLGHIVYQKGVDHRASLFYRSNGNAVIAYQSYDKVVVMERASGSWSVKYVHNNLIQSDQLGGSRAPSLVMKNGDLWVIYADGLNVYKFNIDLPCNYVVLAAKVLLQGAYNTSTGLMNDNLRTLNLIPVGEPFTSLGFTHVGGGGETIATDLYGCTTGSNAIVDWVFLELRDKINPATIVATRSALVQRDGDIVDLDGVSPLTFKNVVPDLYFVAIKHRNHLAIRNANALSVGNSLNSGAIDFTGNPGLYYKPSGHPNEPMATLGGGKYGLFGGNANMNTSVRVSGPAAINDYTKIVNILGSTSNVLTNQYSVGDVNMDGTVRVSGPAAINDYTKIVSFIGGTAVVILQPTF